MSNKNDVSRDLRHSHTGVDERVSRRGTQAKNSHTQNTPNEIHFSDRICRCCRSIRQPAGHATGRHGPAEPGSAVRNPNSVRSFLMFI